MDGLIEPGGPIRLKTLGVLRLEGGRGALGSPRKALSLLAFVCRRAPRAVRREELMALFWGERPEARARQSLRQVLLDLRHVIGERLEIDTDFVRVRGAGLTVDASDFERDVAAGRFADAAERWHGDFLAGAEDAGGEPYRIWVEAEREALRRKLAFALDRLVETAERAGEWVEAVRWAGIWADALPSDAAAHCRLIAALDSAGRREDALARHSAFLVRLRRDLELEPPPELLRLGERLSRPPVAGSREGASPSPASTTQSGGDSGVARLLDAWRSVQAGGPAVVLLAGAHADRARVMAEFLDRASDLAAAPLLLAARGTSAAPLATASLVLAGLRHARGLSGAPDAALGELSGLVPEIRDRFPALPPASGAAGALEAAVAQVLTDVAAEACIVLYVDEVGAADVETSALLRALGRRGLPGVLLLLSDDERRLDAGGFEIRGALRLRSSGDSRLAVPAREHSMPASVEPSATPRRKARRRPARFALMGASACAFIVLLAAVLWPGHAPLVEAERVVVLPFAVHGADRLAYLREGFAELLGTALDGGAGWRTVDAGSMQQAATPGVGLDPTGARALAAKMGAGMFVLGSIAESGRLLRVQASLYRLADEAPLVRATAEGAVDDLFRLVDDVAEQILGHAAAARPGRLAGVAARTTDSLTALKAYLEGESLLRRLRVREAFDAFQRAVAIDSTFALAWYGHAVAASWMLAPDLAGASAQNALHHADRLGQRDRAIVEVLDASLAGRAIEAELLARSVLSRYPDDVELRMQLAEVLFHYSWRRGRKAADAEPELRRVLRSEPAHRPALVHLAQIALQEGRRVEADTLLGQLIDAYGSGPTATWLAVLRAGANGDGRQLDAALEGLRDAGDWWIALALRDLAVYSTDLGAADVAALRLSDAGVSAHARALGHIARAHLQLARGRWQDALAELAPVERLQREWFLEYRSLLEAVPFLPYVPARHDALRLRLIEWPADGTPVPPRPADPRPWSGAHDRAHGLLRLYLLGLSNLRMGSFDEAATQAAQIEARAGAESAPLLARGLAGSLRAQLLRLEGRASDALATLDSTLVEAPFEYAMASPFWSQALERYVRAELLADAGRYDEALGVLRTFGDNSLFDAIYRAPAALKAGEIAERRGEPASAIAHYQRFIRLWQHCDPELRPLVVEAQQRIERLREVGAAPH